MTLSQSSVGRLGLSRKEEERTTLTDRGRSRAAEDTRSGKVGQRTRSILVRSTFGPCENARSGARQNGDFSR